MTNNKKIFKGFKQVTSDSFDNLSNEAKQGYLWFVRTPIFEGEETEEANNVANDSYDIYFGSKQYGHFCKNEIETIKDKITALEGNVVDIIGTLDDLTSIVSGNTASISANTQSITEINQKLTEDFLLKKIDSNDKVLNVADGILSSTISLEYNEGYIKLIGKDNTVISSFDASEFVKDSFLENVEVTEEGGEKYIKFTWNTIDGNATTDSIKVTDFAKFYSAGTALELTTDDTFNVKVASNDNFLTVNNSNELIVTGVTTNKTTTNQAITIEGGPLASDAVKDAFADGIIPAGTDIQEILKALLCQEIYPNPSANTPSYSIRIKSKPTITSSNGIASSSLVEVGQKVIFSSVTAVTVTASTTNPTVSGFSVNNTVYGYSDSIDGDITTSNYITTEWNVEQSDNTYYSLSATTTGFTGDVPATVTGETNSGCVLSGCTLTASLGTNTYKVTETAPDHTGTHSGIASYYIVSNLGNRSEGKLSSPIDAETGATKSASSTATTFTVTGVYPIFTNGIEAGVNDKNEPTGEHIFSAITGDGTKLNLITGGTFCVSFAPQEQAPYTLYIPNNWTLTTAYCKHPTIGTYSVDCYNDFVLSDTTTTRKIQGNDVTYNVYEWTGTQGEDFLKFTVE